jgi:cytochrome c-type biogenesis protein CcmH
MTRKCRAKSACEPWHYVLGCHPEGGDGLAIVHLRMAPQRLSCPSRKGSIAALAFLFALTLIGIAPSARAQETARAKALSQKLMCVCGCNQILGACNHIGCTYSHDMIKELDERVARNEPDDLTVQAFVQEYGPTVLSEPPRKGFNWAAWVMPVAVPLVALIILVEVVRRWRQRAALEPTGGPGVSAALLARAQREAGKEDDE